MSDIDYNQLPIPDWGLMCPNCGYSLRGLPSHRCPECGTQIDVRQLVRPWTRLRPPRFTGEERPLPDFGLSCAACGAALAGAVGRVCLSCGAAFDLAAVRPKGEWFVLDADICAELPIPGVQSLLAGEGVPHAPVNEKRLADLYGGGSVLPLQLRVPSEFYFETLWLVRQARVDAAAAQQARERGTDTPWRCAGCGAENPGNFEVCWQCEAARG